MFLVRTSLELRGRFRVWPNNGRHIVTVFRVWLNNGQQCVAVAVVGAQCR